MVFTPGWSIGWFFIPIANFWKPYRVMREIWDVSHRSKITDSSLVGLWWGFWLVSNFVGRIAFKFVVRAEDASGYATSALVYAVSDVVDVILDFIAIGLVASIGQAYSDNIAEPTSNNDTHNVVE